MRRVLMLCMHQLSIHGRKREQGCLCRSNHRDPFCALCCPSEPPRGDVSTAFTEESSARVVIAAIESWANLRERGSRWLPALDMEHEEAVEAGIAGAWASQLEEEIAEGERLLESFVRWQTVRQLDSRQLYAYLISDLLGLLHVGIARRTDYLACYA